jgi:transaldolase
MPTSRLHALAATGTSTWLDFIDRGLLDSGALATRIAEDALAGMTSNPSIFEKALEGTAYDAAIRAAGELAPRALFERLATRDVRDACDQFLGVYRQTDGVDGYVSIEVSPDLSNDAAGTVEEARRLWATIDRPNVMIKVPGTVAGADAVRTLIAEGINVNVTLLFAVEAHARVIEAYLAGLEARAAQGLPLRGVASVASFFVSRVDSEVDKRLDARMVAAPDAAARERLAALKGQAAIANARLAYQLFVEQFSGARWEKLAAAGARVQRPLWASTSTKNPAYRDVMYVEQLAGPHTVNTMPPATLDAFRDHGESRDTLTGSAAGARATLDALAREGIAMDEVTEKLLVEGLAAFVKSFETLLGGLARKVGAAPVGAGR